MTDDLAAMKARMARVTEAAQAYTIDDLVEERGPNNISVWKLGDAISLQPSLINDAPEMYVDLMRRRAWANLSGECPDCGAVSGVKTTTSGAMLHENRCHVGHLPKRLADYIDPLAVRMIDAYGRSL